MLRQPTPQYNGDPNSPYADIFAKAKATGERQIIRFQVAGCCDPELNCDLDYLGFWAMPDGTIARTRTHTD